MAHIKKVKRLFQQAKQVWAFLVKTGDQILNIIIVDKLLMVINQLQEYTEAYKSLKALSDPDQDFTHLIQHFKAAERFQKKCQDSAQDRRYGMHAEAKNDALQQATRGLTDLTNSLQ